MPNTSIKSDLIKDTSETERKRSASRTAESEKQKVENAFGIYSEKDVGAFGINFRKVLLLAGVRLLDPSRFRKDKKKVMPNTANSRLAVEPAKPTAGTFVELGLARGIPPALTINDR